MALRAEQGMWVVREASGGWEERYRLFSTQIRPILELNVGLGYSVAATGCVYAFQPAKTNVWPIGHISITGIAVARVS